MITWLFHLGWYCEPALKALPAPILERFAPPTIPLSSVGLVQRMWGLFGAIPSAWYRFSPPPLSLSCDPLSQLDETVYHWSFCPSIGRVQYSVGTGCKIGSPLIFTGSCWTITVNV